MHIRSLRILVAVSAIAFTTLGVHAATVSLKVDLKGASEVPPKETSGTGTVTATLDTDTNELKYQVAYSGLSGPVVAAHFHGPAGEGVNAKPQVPVKGPYERTINGSATITAEQAKDLVDGKWYFNLHTAANPGGEIRGQLVKVQ